MRINASLSGTFRLIGVVAVTVAALLAIPVPAAASTGQPARQAGARSATVSVAHSGTAAAASGTPAGTLTILKRCTSVFFDSFGDSTRACVQENTSSGQFNVVVDFVEVAGVSASIHSRLEQCRGDGTHCVIVSKKDQNITGATHVFVATPLVNGAHGHAYRSTSSATDTAAGTVNLVSPFIAFP